MVKDLVRFGGVGAQVGQEPSQLLPKQEVGGKGLRYIDIGYHSFVPASMQYVVDTIRGSVQSSSVNTGQENFQLAVKDVGNKAEWKHRMENYDVWKQDYDSVITEGHNKGKPKYTTALSYWIVEVMTELHLRAPRNRATATSSGVTKNHNGGYARMEGIRGL